MRKIKGLHDYVRVYDSGYRGDCPVEYIEQINAVTWFREHYPQHGMLFFHVANESSSKPQYRAKLNKMGVTAGIADLVLLVPSGPYYYAVFEMKRTGKGYLSNDQKKHLNAVAEAGGFACMCRGANEFKKAVDDYLQL